MVFLAGSAKGVTTYRIPKEVADVSENLREYATHGAGDDLLLDERIDLASSD